mmetsp:Transcript_52131/g.134932  ORF Transcript_52131/g.134932 Transcript_52131/m.134932 type:complete len:252 (+) Transcript_52131:829-1584(+)
MASKSSQMRSRAMSTNCRSYTPQRRKASNKDAQQEGLNSCICLIASARTNAAAGPNSRMAETSPGTGTAAGKACTPCVAKASASTVKCRGLNEFSRSRATSAARSSSARSSGVGTLIRAAASAESASARPLQDSSREVSAATSTWKRPSDFTRSSVQPPLDSSLSAGEVSPLRTAAAAAPDGYVGMRYLSRCKVASNVEASAPSFSTPNFSASPGVRSARSCRTTAGGSALYDRAASSSPSAVWPPEAPPP